LIAGSAIGIVRPQGQLFQQQREVAIRNCIARRIDRSGERRGPDPPQEPSVKLALRMSGIETLIFIAAVVVMVALAVWIGL
jgi:hypothetical protein